LRKQKPNHPPKPPSSLHEEPRFSLEEKPILFPFQVNVPSMAIDHKVPVEILSILQANSSNFIMKPLPNTKVDLNYLLSQTISIQHIPVNVPLLSTVQTMISSLNCEPLKKLVS